jgi:hypothetical protein
LSAAEIVQYIVDITFKGTLVYLAPMIFLLMVTLSTDRIIDLIYEAFLQGERRRYKWY